MKRRTGSLIVLVVLALLCSFSFAGAVSAPLRIHAAVKTATSRAAARWSARMKSPSPPVSKIGFLSAPQVPAGGYDNTTYFPPVSGDFNGDGNKDAVTVVKLSGKYQISVALGNGDGTFQAAKLTVTTATAADPIWVGDLDGDGNDDVVMGHQGTPATFEAWLSKGDGTFTLKGATSLGNPSHVTWGTLYHNPVSNHLDVVIADGVNSKVWATPGNGDGTFGVATSAAFSPAISPNANVAFADFDGDGKLDFAATDATTNQDEVFFNTGSGYAAPVLLDTPDHKYDSCFDAAGDLNGDGKIDIVSAGANCNPADLLQDKLTVYLNTSDGKFTAVTGTYYSVGIRPEAVTIADVNGDGHNDVVTVTTQPGNVRVLLGNGDGTLQNASVGYATGGNAKTQAIVDDFNNDGNADVIVSDEEFSFVYFQGYGDGSFRSALNYYAQPNGNGFHPNGVGIASGDFNGDGLPDFVIGNYNDSATTGVAVFLTNADGSLQAGVPYNPSGSTELQYVAVADFDGDGKLDIAAANSANLVTCTVQPCGVVQVFTGNGDGTFATGGAYRTGSAGTDATRSPLGLVVGDFNGDGKPDLAVVNNYSGTTADVGILLNDGTGKFLAATNYPLSNLATEISAADLNGDNKLDLVAPLYGTNAVPDNRVSVLLGNGNGTFQAESLVALGFNNPYAVAVGDLNGDGKPDLAVTIDDQTTSLQGIALAPGKGDGTFNPATLVPSTLQNPVLDVPNPGYVKVMDLDRDGHLDLIYTNSQFGTLGLLYGKGDGTFYDPVEFAAGHRAFDIALGDVNADGVLDVVATGNAAAFSGATVLLNNSGDGIALKSSNPNSPPGVSVTFTATVSGSPVRGITAVPSGTVSFFDGATQLGSPVPLSSGVATFSTSTLAVGSHNITARYSGDANYVAHTSAVLVQVVQTGQQPDYTLTPDQNSKTVNPGSSASFTITLKPSNGYDGTVTISCPATLPTGVTCVPPSPMSPPYAPATLTIRTTAPSAALSAPANVNPHPQGLSLSASLVGVGMFGLVLTGDWKKRNRRGMTILLAVLAIAMILGLVGCGGGSSNNGGGGGGGGGGGTPAGTYQIQVTATGTAGTNGGNTTAHPLNLTLVVN